ncbi:MAG: hypothetical protein ABH836_04675 [Candidatus Omnitrophota bacterium]
MNPDSFLDLAKKLNDGEIILSEAKIRTAISRAYYFIFLKIRQKLEKSGFDIVETSESHRQITDLLKKTQDTNAIKVALGLQSLRTKRNTADYNMKDLGFEFPSQAAGLAIREASNLDRDFCQIDEETLKSNI